MGYYTAYELTVERATGPFDAKELETAIETLGIFKDGSLFGNGLYGFAKWYDHDDDMCALSEKFPTVVLKLHGDGDASDDLWDTYYWNGCFQHCPAMITYEPFCLQSCTERL